MKGPSNLGDAKISLTNTRYALITEPGENNIYEKDSLNSDVIARAENGVVAKIKRCGQSFCQLEF